MNTAPLALIERPLGAKKAALEVTPSAHAAAPVPAMTGGGMTAAYAAMESRRSTLLPESATTTVPVALSTAIPVGPLRPPMNPFCCPAPVMRAMRLFPVSVIHVVPPQSTARAEGLAYNVVVARHASQPEQQPPVPAYRSVKQPTPVLVGVGVGVVVIVVVAVSVAVEEGDAATLREGVGVAEALGVGQESRRTAWLRTSTTYSAPSTPTTTPRGWYSLAPPIAAPSEKPVEPP
jgi:hypothetical protein